MTNAFLRSGLYGALFCDKSIADDFGDAAFVGRMRAFEAAWTRALAKTGDVSDEDAATALEAIAASTRTDFSDGSDTDGLPVPAFVAALREGLDAGPARAIHTGATSQDVLDTAMSLTCLSVLDEVEARLTKVVARLDDLLARFGDAPLTARTRMQAALPATVALRVEAWRRPLIENLARLGPLRTEVGCVQIGGAIGTRGEPAGKGQDMAELVAAELNLEIGPVWHSDRVRPVSMGHMLTLIAGSLGKIGQDVALMAQQGLDEIALSGGGGSSAMPHKQNPVLAETMVSLARFVAGQQGVLSQAMIHEQERSGAAWALEWLTLPAMAEATGASLRHADRLLSSIERIGEAD
jgi:3-carboxy-cis,cis-muconate cycloisomerase